MPFDYSKTQDELEKRNIKKYRCPNCNKLLFEGSFNGIVIKICPNCKPKREIVFKNS